MISRNWLHWPEILEEGQRSSLWNLLFLSKCRQFQCAICCQENRCVHLCAFTWVFFLSKCHPFQCAISGQKGRCVHLHACSWFFDHKNMLFLSKVTNSSELYAAKKTGVFIYMACVCTDGEKSWFSSRICQASAKTANQAFSCKMAPMLAGTFVTVWACFYFWNITS